MQCSGVVIMLAVAALIMSIILESRLSPRSSRVVTLNGSRISVVSFSTVLDQVFSHLDDELDAQRAGELTTTQGEDGTITYKLLMGGIAVECLNIVVDNDGELVVAGTSADGKYSMRRLVSLPRPLLDIHAITTHIDGGKLVISVPTSALALVPKSKHLPLSSRSSVQLVALDSAKSATPVDSTKSATPAEAEDAKAKPEAKHNLPTVPVARFAYAVSAPWSVELGPGVAKS
ncbi:hypothetical protein T492DRAFT_836349 [Pavlovales sp. CCMP2436]|nr:hypothetical protein T492DRAFT_836349 [Pavlovales sp. CCMP2436]